MSVQMTSSGNVHHTRCWQMSGSEQRWLLLPQAVFDLYRQMEEYHVRPTVDTYNTLLKACMLQGETRQAMTIFKRLRNSRRGPDVVTYTTLINGFSDAGRPTAAVSPCTRHSACAAMSTNPSMTGTLAVPSRKGHCAIAACATVCPVTLWYIEIILAMHPWSCPPE